MSAETTPAGVAGPGWAGAIGVAALLLGVLFTAHEGTEWMRELVIESATPASLELPAAECPADELEEEGLSVAECEQLVADVRSYIVSRPAWFSTVQAWVAAIGTLLGLASIVLGAALASFRLQAARACVLVFSLLAVVDAAQFVAAQQAGPILRAIHLPAASFWFSVHLALAIASHVAGRRRAEPAVTPPEPASYGRFEVAAHWFLAISIFFLFVSSWWMLALPLPSDVFRFREFPFQLHKNLGITIALAVVAMALIRILSRQALAARAETVAMQRLRLGGHAALYLLILVVCVTGYMSSSYSGWGTTWWWLIDFPYWGHENEELNQLYSDLHLWACWALLLALAAHIGAALYHAFRNDGVMRRIVRW